MPGFNRWFWALLISAPLWSAVTLFAGAVEDVELGLKKAQALQFEEAITLFNQALDSGDLNNNQRAITLNNRGVAYKATGQLEFALLDQMEALRLRPHHPRQLYNRGVVYFLIGEYQQAAVDFQALIRRLPGTPTPYPHLWLYLSLAYAG